MFVGVELVYHLGSTCGHYILQEQLKLTKQLQRCYAANRRSVSPFQVSRTYNGRDLSDTVCICGVTVLCDQLWWEPEGGT